MRLQSGYLEYLKPYVSCRLTFVLPKPVSSAVPIRHTRMSGIHFYAMSSAISASVRRGKTLKMLLIIVLVWMTPGVLLFIHLARKNQLLARHIRSLKRTSGEHALTDEGQGTSQQNR